MKAGQSGVDGDSCSFAGEKSTSTGTWLFFLPLNSLPKLLRFVVTTNLPACLPASLVASTPPINQMLARASDVIARCVVLARGWIASTYAKLVVMMMMFKWHCLAIHPSIHPTIERIFFFLNLRIMLARESNLAHEWMKLRAFLGVVLSFAIVQCVLTLTFEVRSSSSLLIWSRLFTCTYMSGVEWKLWMAATKAARRLTGNVFVKVVLYYY